LETDNKSIRENHTVVPCVSKKTYGLFLFLTFNLKDWDACFCHEIVIAENFSHCFNCTNSTSGLCEIFTTDSSCLILYDFGMAELIIRSIFVCAFWIGLLCCSYCIYKSAEKSNVSAGNARSRKLIIIFYTLALILDGIGIIICVFSPDCLKEHEFYAMYQLVRFSVWGGIFAIFILYGILLSICQGK